MEVYTVHCTVQLSYSPILSLFIPGWYVAETEHRVRSDQGVGREGWQGAGQGAGETSQGTGQGAGGIGLSFSSLGP